MYNIVNTNNSNIIQNNGKVWNCRNDRKCIFNLDNKFGILSSICLNSKYYKDTLLMRKSCNFKLLEKKAKKLDNKDN